MAWVWGRGYPCDWQQMGAWPGKQYEILFSEADDAEITHFGCKQTFWDKKSARV